MAKKKDVSAMIRAAGWIGSFTGLLVEELQKMGVPAEEVHKLCSPTEDGRALVRACAEAIARAVKDARNIFPVTIDSQSLKEMIVSGGYDWVNPDITAEHFPIKERGEVKTNLELVHFNHAMSTNEALKELDKRGLSPAKIEGLLAFGAAYPVKQLEFPIICLGSVWAGPLGDRDVPSLGRGGSVRKLDLVWVGRGWDAFCRFLAVRK